MSSGAIGHRTEAKVHSYKPGGGTRGGVCWGYSERASGAIGPRTGAKPG